MSLEKRYVLFICGLFFMSAGICLIIKSSLGTSPISGIPYILSLRYPVSLGIFSFILNMIFLLLQKLILKSDFTYMHLLQIPMMVIFSCFLDLSMYLLNSLHPALYLMKMLVLFLGCLALSLGVALQIIANVVMLPGEGIVYAIIKRWKADLGYTKTFFDINLVVITALLSLCYFEEIRGIREGTLVSALIVGIFAKVFMRHLSKVDKKGELTFYPHLQSSSNTLPAPHNTRAD
jgi:uncharacterized membrane protein YczE